MFRFALFLLALGYSADSAAQVDHQMDVTNNTNCNITIYGEGVDAGWAPCSSPIYITQGYIVAPASTVVLSWDSNWSGGNAPASGEVDWVGLRFVSGCPTGGSTSGCVNNIGAENCGSSFCMYVTCGACAGTTATSNILGTTAAGGLSLTIDP